MIGREAALIAAYEQAIANRLRGPESGLSGSVKVFGRLRTKTSHAGTRVPQVLCYGESGFWMVLVVLGAAQLSKPRLA